MNRQLSMEFDSEMNDSNMDLEKHVDVIRKYNDGNLYSAFIIENQSCVDPSMVVRAAVYEYVAYERMLKKSKKNKSKEKLPMVHILVFYTGERPWNAARQLSELVEVDERFKSYFHDYQMNLIEITGNTSYNFNEEDVYNLFYICRSIYDQSIYEGTINDFGLVKSSVLKVVKTLTDVEWLDLKELEEKEEIEMCEAGEHIDGMLNERLLSILSTKENVNLQTLGFSAEASGGYQAIITPINIAGDRKSVV